MFEVDHGGTFNRQYRCSYVGGTISNYLDPYEGNKLTFFVIEDICKMRTLFITIC